VNGPWLVFETTQHDFGKVLDTDLVEFKFAFRNAGNEPLVFSLPLRVGTSEGVYPCSARNPGVQQGEFAPGECGFIRATLNPAGKSGEVRRRITVDTNDPVQPEQTLTYTAIVKRVFQCDPPLVDFGEVPFGQTRSRVVTITGMGADFNVTYASVSKGRYVTAKVLDQTPVTIDGDQMNQCRLELTINGRAPRGTLNAISTVRTASERVPLADFNVVAEVIGDLQVLPPKPDLGVVDANQPFTNVLTVSSRSSTPFKILKVEQRANLPAPLQFTVTPIEGANGTSCEVVIKGMSPGAAAPLTANLILTTDRPAPDDSIPVMLRGSVRPPAYAPQVARGTPSGSKPIASPGTTTHRPRKPPDED
jgi:hypothetical protein